MRFYHSLGRRSLTSVLLALALALPLFAAGTREASGTSPTAHRGQLSLVQSETSTSLICLDADGNPVRLTKNPKRTIVNYTSLVGLWYQAGGTAVGMPETANLAELPEAARTIRTTGHTANPNIEAVLALEPDFVILANNMEKQRAMADILKAAGIEVLMLQYENYGDYVGILDLFYRLNGGSIAQDAASELMQNEVEDLVSRSKAQAAVKFLSLFASARDVQAETNRAHVAFMASYLGAQNITSYSAPSRSQTRLPFSIERIHMEDPDVIFVTTMGNSDQIRQKMRQDFMESQVWQGLKAVQTGRVHFLPNELFLYKPNERFAEAFRQLAELLHPDGL